MYCLCASDFRMLARMIFRTVSTLKQIGKPVNTVSVTQRCYCTTDSTTRLVAPIFLTAEKFQGRTALVDQHGSHTYNDILNLSHSLASDICDTLDKTLSIQQERVAFLCPNDISYIVSKMSTWMADGVAVPLSPIYPTSELAYFLQDSQAKLVISTEEFADKIESANQNIGIKHLVLKKSDYLPDISDKLVEDQYGTNENDDLTKQQRRNRLHQLYKTGQFSKRNALFVYTSGTTGKPKVQCCYNLGIKWSCN